MKIGIGLPTTSPNVVEQMAQAEELGFDYLACGEHIMFHVPSRNTLITLACASAATRTIQLLSAITLAPLYPPVLLAKLASSLDDISGGRFNLGVGVGGEYPTEFEALGVPVTERGRRADEFLDLLRRLWTGEQIDFHGQFTSFTGGQLLPKPLRDRLPVWVSGRKDAAIRRAARHGDAWMPYMYTPEMLAASIEKLAAFAADLGRDPAEIPAFANCFITVCADGNAARRTSRETVEGVYQQDMSRAARYFVAGTPEECRQRLQEYADAGAAGAIMNPGCPEPDYDRMMIVFAEEVMPGLRPAVPSG